LKHSKKADFLVKFSVLIRKNTLYLQPTIASMPRPVVKNCQHTRRLSPRDLRKLLSQGRWDAAITLRFVFHVTEMLTH